jgi:site-specific DNA recombinase
MKIRQLQNIMPQKENIKLYYLLYCRKSSESEDQQLESITSQLEYLKDYAIKNNLKIIKIFTESQSAKSPGRLEFNKMVSLIEKSDNIKGILCWDVSRLFRNPIDEGKIRWLLDNQNISEVRTPYKTYQKDDSSLIMAVEGGKSQAFIQDLTRNTKRGVDRKIENGHAPILAPVGYINNTHLRQGERSISPHPLYFKLMRKIFQLALQGQYSTDALRIKAEDMGIKNNRGKSISKTQMQRILRDPFYTGRFLYAGKLYQGCHKQLITDNEFDALQDVLEGKTHDKKQSHIFPLTGLVRCGYCNYRITAEEHIKPSGLVFNYYRCVGRIKGICDQPIIPSSILEEQVFNFLGTIKISDAFFEWIKKWLRYSDEKDRETRSLQFKALREQHNDLETKLFNLKEKWLSGKDLLNDEEFTDTKQSIIQRLYKVDRKLKNLDKDWEEYTDLTIATFNFAKTAQDRWLNGGVEEKKYIMYVIGSNLILKDNKLDIKPKTPFLIIKNALDATKLKSYGSNHKYEPDLGTKDFQSSVMGRSPTVIRTHFIANFLEAEQFKSLLFNDGGQQFYA